MSYAKLGAILFAISAAFAAGWIGRGYKADSDTLVIERAANAAIQKDLEHEKDVAQDVEKSLTAIEAQIQRTLKDHAKYLNRPVYDNPCRDADGLRAINILSTVEAGTGDTP